MLVLDHPTGTQGKSAAANTGMRPLPLMAAMTAARCSLAAEESALRNGIELNVQRPTTRHCPVNALQARTAQRAVGVTWSVRTYRSR